MHELDPQVLALLAQLRQQVSMQLPQDVKPSAWQTILAMRERMSRMTPGGAPEPVARVEDRMLPGPHGRDLAVRIYDPRAQGEVQPAAQPAPALVYCHGGGFVAGGLDSHDTLLRALANRAHCVVISVDYRLAPEHPYPCANEDVWAALLWAAMHGAAAGIDTQRLAVGGDSAGGLLAAWLAQKARQHGVPLRLQLLLYPNLDATTSHASWQTLGSGEFLVMHARMLEWYDAWLPPGIDRRDPAVSPLFANDLTGLAAAFVVTADHDPLCDEGNVYAARLRDARVDVDHLCWPGMIHGFASMAGTLDAGRQVIEKAAAALREAFMRD